MTHVHVLVIGTDITPSLVETAYECGREFERRFAGPHGVLIDYHGSLRVPPFAVRAVMAVTTVLVFFFWVYPAPIITAAANAAKAFY